MSSPANPQSIQMLLDENAQLIKALVENMNIKGKATECIQYQQSLHKNLVFLASLADPSLNVQSILPPPGSIPRQQQANGGQTPPSSTATTAPHSVPGGAGGAVSSHMTTSSMSAQRQPQVTPASTSTPASVPSESMRATPPAGQFPPGSGKGYGGSPWSGGPGQPGDPFSMQRPGGPTMGPGGPMGGGYPPMGMSPEQQLRMRQEQMIQARRMQQAAAGGGGMYPGPPPPPPGAPGMMPPQGQMPPGYPAPGPPPPANPHGMPPGGRKMH